MREGRGMGLTGHGGEALASADPGVPDRCYPEHSGLVEVRILSQEKSIGNGRADQWSYKKGYQVFFRLYGANELKKGPKGAIWSHLPPAISY